MKRWSLLLVVGLGAGLLVGLRPGGNAGPVSSLRLVFEVRDKIHRHYVEEVDSLEVIDAGIDGLVSALPEGENLYLSPAEMVSVGAERPRPALDNRGQVEVLAEVFRRVSQEYIDQVPADTLAQGVVWGMLAALDPHSSYLDAGDYAEMIERFRGDFEGIGIYFEIRQGRLLVISPIVGSPSYGKLRAGDQIVQIEGVSTEGITSEEVMDKLRGPKGSQVRVAVQRQGRESLLRFTIERDRIEIRSVPYAFMLEPGTGYVRIIRFAETTGEELSRALQRLRGQGMQRLVLDLRDNGGGLLSQAVEVADYFLPAGALIVYTEGRSPSSRREYRASGAMRGAFLPLVVMIDHGSASASEIVAGAVQDLDLGLVVGQTSFGKGLVQEQFPLDSNGGLLLLTVARYYTPLGRLIQRPFTDGVQAYVQAGFDSIDSNSVDSLRAGKQIFRTGLGRAVYGGGGITPDVVLKADYYSDFALELYSSGALADFSGHWAGKRRGWPADFERFRNEYEVPESALRDFAAFLAARGAAARADSLAAHREFLRRELKAGLARVLWGEEQYYQVHVGGDGELRQAVALFPQAEKLVAARRTRY